MTFGDSLTLTIPKEMNVDKEYLILYKGSWFTACHLHGTNKFYTDCGQRIPAQDCEAIYELP